MTKMKGWGAILAILVLAVGGLVMLFANNGSISSLMGSCPVCNISTPSVGNSEVYFCPEDHCGDQLISKINSAQTTVDIAIYSFTHDGLGAAVIAAKQRGVSVRVVFDNDQAANDYSEDEKFMAEGILVKKRNGSGYMHNKFTVIDGNFVATGSFNYSANADEKNDENLIFLWSKDLAAKYTAEFEELWAQSN
ncbi:MAG: phospholipase D family protein [archaeon]